MEMTVIFDKLKMLQDILAEKYTIENQISEAPKKLSFQEGFVANLKKEYIEKSEEYEKVRVSVLSLKTELAEAVAAREHGEKGMDSISTHREYETLEKEIEAAEKKEKEVREKLLKEDKVLQELGESLNQDEEYIKNQESELKKGQDSLNEEIDSLNSRLEELASEEKTIVPDLDPEIVFKFERIIKSKHNKGIVAVKGNVCDGCHMILPSQFANEVHNGDKIVFCPYCSRILFYQDTDDDSEYFNIEDAGSLVDFDDDFDDESDDEIDDEEDSSDELKELEFDE